VATLTITPANVALSGTGNHTTFDLEADVTIARGKVVKRNSSNEGELADKDSSDCDGICISGGDNGDKIIVVSKGLVTIGATTVQGKPYFLGDSGGIVDDIADVASGEFPVLIGFGNSTTEIMVNIVKSLVAVP